MKVAMLKTVSLLVVANIFMTFAWYGHLKFPNAVLWKTILISWSIALLEYCFQVPANRAGHDVGIPTATLKIIQEVITLAVFAIFSITVLRESLSWNHAGAFVLLVLAAALVVMPGKKLNPPPAAETASTVHPQESP